mmetsp:Transcript_24836/g.63001  ORF Transcript_24836/g.63001 Transcript_24836/m.63001 type:complete len:458 (+) Transcript_24836:167-1540(+)
MRSQPHVCAKCAWTGHASPFLHCASRLHRRGSLHGQEPGHIQPSIGAQGLCCGPFQGLAGLGGRLAHPGGTLRAGLDPAGSAHCTEECGQRPRRAGGVPPSPPRGWCERAAVPSLRAGSLPQPEGRELPCEGERGQAAAVHLPADPQRPRHRSQGAGACEADPHPAGAPGGPGRAGAPRGCERCVRHPEELLGHDAAGGDRRAADGPDEQVRPRQESAHGARCCGGGLQLGPAEPLVAPDPGGDPAAAGRPAERPSAPRPRSLHQPPQHRQPLQGRLRQQRRGQRRAPHAPGRRAHRGPGGAAAEGPAKPEACHGRIRGQEGDLRGCSQAAREAHGSVALLPGHGAAGHAVSVSASALAPGPAGPAHARPGLHARRGSHQARHGALPLRREGGQLREGGQRRRRGATQDGRHDAASGGRTARGRHGTGRQEAQAGWRWRWQVSRGAGQVHLRACRGG